LLLLFALFIKYKNFGIEQVTIAVMLREVLGSNLGRENYPSRILGSHSGDFFWNMTPCSPLAKQPTTGIQPVVRS
jgi:hypothetical protein